MKNNIAIILLIAVIVGFGTVIWADRSHMPKYKQEFIKIEKQRIVTTNKLTTAKIVQENLNHVRELVFNNMDFPGQPDTVDHETQFYNFVTTCINDLKLKLVSVKPVKPKAAGRITTYGYDVEIEGDFFKFGELCAKFENNRRIVSVETFDVDLIDKGKTDRHNDPKVKYIAPANDYKGVKIKMRVNTYRIKKT